VFHFPGSGAGRQLARAVLASLLAAFPRHRDRGAKPANLAVLRQTRMPAILVECEFLTNPRQLRFLAQRGNQRLLAAAIVAGVDQFGSSVSRRVRRDGSLAT
jgi:N-acetylmuramoyl-L-alanine amidase